MCVSSQNHRTRKEEGPTVAATYLLSGETVRAGLVRAERAAILHGDNFTGNPHKIPLMSYLRRETRNAKHKTRNTKHETRNAGDFQSSD
jgi:hypothetical protein